MTFETYFNAEKAAEERVEQQERNGNGKLHKWYFSHYLKCEVNKRGGILYKLYTLEICECTCVRFLYVFKKHNFTIF